MVSCGSNKRRCTGLHSVIKWLGVGGFGGGCTGGVGSPLCNQLTRRNRYWKSGREPRASRGFNEMPRVRTQSRSQYRLRAERPHDGTSRGSCEGNTSSARGEDKERYRVGTECRRREIGNKPGRTALLYREGVR